MTVVCAIRTAEALFVAADSQSTLRLHNLPAPHNVATTYARAEKVGQLLAEHCLAWFSWGAGSIGGISIREAVARFPQYLENLTARKDGVEWYALRFRDLLIELSNKPVDPGHNAKPEISIAICGFGGLRQRSQIWTFSCSKGSWSACKEFKESMLWAGDGAEAIQRLQSGLGSAFAERLDSLIPQASEQRRQLKKNAVALVHPEMPYGDALDCLRFLLNTCFEFNRFVQAPSSIGKPFDIAALSVGRGFEWIEGKHK